MPRSGTPKSAAITRSRRLAQTPTGEILHIRNRKGAANTQRGIKRFVDELIARVRRAGYDGLIAIRADVGFANHKLFETLDQRGIEFSIGVKQSTKIKRLIEQTPETAWVTLSEVGFGAWRAIVRRTRLLGDQA